MTQKVIVPKGLINPNETTIIEIPANLQGRMTVVAKTKKADTIYTTVKDLDTTKNTVAGDVSNPGTPASQNIPSVAPTAPYNSPNSNVVKYREQYKNMFGEYPYQYGKQSQTLPMPSSRSSRQMPFYSTGTEKTTCQNCALGTCLKCQLKNRGIYGGKESNIPSAGGAFPNQRNIWAPPQSSAQPPLYSAGNYTMPAMHPQPMPQTMFDTTQPQPAWREPMRRGMGVRATASSTKPFSGYPQMQNVWNWEANYINPRNADRTPNWSGESPTGVPSPYSMPGRRPGIPLRNAESGVMPQQKRFQQSLINDLIEEEEGNVDVLEEEIDDRNTTNNSSQKGRDLDIILDAWEQSEVQKIQEDLEIFQRARRNLIKDATGLGETDLTTLLL